MAPMRLIVATFIVGLAAPVAAQAAAPIRLIDPSPGASLSDVVFLRASAPGARAVVFFARFSDIDGVSRVHHLATDRSPRDGWTTRWNATAFRSQSGVTVFARAVGRGGRTLSTTAERPLSARVGPDPQIPAPPAPVSPPSAGTTLTVVGTCEPGVACTLAVRALPDANAVKVGALPEGARVMVRCQSIGARVTTRRGSTNVWNQIANGQWVSDLYLSKPIDQRPPAPCAPAPAPPPAR